MSALLLMLCWLPPAVSVSGVPPAPQNLHVKSVNLRHVLQWERGVGTSPEVTYSVSYHTDRGQRIVVCERVQEPLLCNLTLACSEPDEIYHLQVTAHQHSAQSSMSWDGFHPIRHTELLPPVLQVAICNSSLCIDMDTPVPHLHSIYDNFWYELKVERDGTQLPMKLIRSLQREVIPGVRAGSQYCVSVRFADRIVPRESSFGPPQCVLLSPSPTPPSSAAAVHGLLISGLLLLLLFLVVFVTVFLYPKKPGLPSVLTSVRHCEEKLEVTCHPAASSRLFIEVAPTEEQSEYCSSETDSSDGEQDEAGGSVHAGQYKSKTSLSSQHGSAASQVHKEEPEEEVDLLTLTFSRDKEPDPSARLLYEEELQPCEEELSLCELTTQQTEHQEESEEESFQTGYMSHPAVCS